MRWRLLAILKKASIIGEDSARSLIKLMEGVSLEGAPVVFFMFLEVRLSCGLLE